MDRTTTLLAEFAASLQPSALSAAAVEAVDLVLLDALGCAMGGVESETARIARRLAAGRSGTPAASLLGIGDPTTPEAAAFANTVALRYLDANDHYQGAAGAGHPSDVLGALFAAAEVAGATIGELRLAVAVAYEVFFALAEVVPLRDRGWDQGVFIAPAVAAGAGRLLGLSAAQIGEAIAMAGTAYVPTRQTRSGDLGMWKGVATAATGQGALLATLLAAEGMTGPTAAYEGGDGLWQQVTGPFTLGALPAAGALAVERVNYKRFPSEYHSQGPLAVMIELRERVPVASIASIEVGLYRMAYGEIGSGEVKWDPQTRETADHSLPYILAVALTDGAITPSSFALDRVRDPALRPLMARIRIVEDDDLTRRYPAELPTRIEVTTTSGERIVERTTYPGGHARNPVGRAELEAKFRGLSVPVLGDAGCARALDVLRSLDASQPVRVIFDAMRAPAR